MARKKCLLVLVLVVSLAVVAFLVSDACAWKAIKPICDTNGKVTGWQDEQIPDNRVPMGVNEVQTAVGVFGFPKEEYGLKITPEEAQVDTSKPVPPLSVKVAPGDELPTSGPWNGRCYLQYQTSYLGMELKPLKDYCGDFQFDLMDKEGLTRTRKVYQWRRPFYGEGGFRSKEMVYFFEPSDLRGFSITVWKPVDEAQADNSWIYLPAMRRIRRITVSQKMESFGGMDVTYDQMDRASGMWDAKIAGEIDLYVDKPPLNNCFGTEPHRGLLDGKHCVIVEMTPRNKDWPISKELLYFGKKDANLYYEETYDKGGQLIKILLPFFGHMYPKQPMYWTFGDWYANDLRTGHKTFLYFPEIDKAGNKVLDYKKRDWSNYVFWYDTGYSDDYLSQKFMMTGTR